MTQRRLTIHTALTVPPARMTLNHQEYLTAPVVLVVEGVLNHGLIPGEELHPQDWDGVAITIGHPMDAEGRPHSARQPEVLAACGVGRVFHTSLSAGQRQGHAVASLRGELWINLAEVAQCGREAEQAVAMLESQTPLEVSTAFFSQAEQTRGSFYGTPYGEIHRHLRPDHLALLPNTVGACNWADGCGAPRLNHADLHYSGCACTGDSCTCHQGEPSMEPSVRGWRGFVHALREFLRQAEHVEPDEHSLMQEDHLSQSIPWKQREVNAAVERRRLHMPLTTHERSILLAPDAYLRSHGPLVHQTDLDLREALYGCLAREMGVDFTPLFIDAIDVTTNTFVYRQGERLRRRAWTVEEGVVSLSPDVEDVQRETTFHVVPLPTTNQEEPMATTEVLQRRINALIANTATGWTEDDRHFLESQSEAFLIRLEHQPVATPPPTYRAPATMQEAIATLPAHLREPMEAMTAEYEARKDAAMRILVANAECPFSQEELQGWSAQRLEQLVAMAGEEVPPRPGAQIVKEIIRTDYTGRRFPTTLSADPDDQPPPPPNTFAKVVERQKVLGMLVAP